MLFWALLFVDLLAVVVWLLAACFCFDCYFALVLFGVSCWNCACLVGFGLFCFGWVFGKVLVGIGV